MYREENLTIDLKVKEYNSLRLKQMDSTKLNMKLIDDGLAIDLTDINIDIVFMKPNKTIVMQSSNIIVEDNIISVILLEDCLRMSGYANMEVELKKDTQVVSSFFIPITIEPTSKENVQSDNTPNYIETLEEAIKQEAIRQQNETDRMSAETSRVNAEDERIDAENVRKTNETDRISAETSRVNAEDERIDAENVRKTNETDRMSAETSRVNAENARVEEFKKIKENSISINEGDIAQLKKEVIIQTAVIVTTESIPDNTDYTIPLYYKVGNNSLEIYYMGEKLVKGTHYIEVGESGAISNIIQFYNWGQAVPIGRTIEFTIRGDYSAS